jgi:hypothetical protein
MEVRKECQWQGTTPFRRCWSTNKNPNPNIPP